jgi:hypothetical protein
MKPTLLIAAGLLGIGIAVVAAQTSATLQAPSDPAMPT